MILFIDTETTGLPSQYAAMNQQPYVVQIAAVLCDSARTTVARLNHLVRPDGWVIPTEATAIHGFTTEYCKQHGVPLTVAINDLLQLWTRADRVVSYNVSFDHWMIELSARRVHAILPPKDLYCAMRESAKLINANGRWVKLATAYQCFFGRSFDNAHNAEADVEACKAIYYAIADTLSPVRRLVGDVRPMTARSLRRAMTGAGEVHEHERLVHSFLELHRTPLQPINWHAVFAQPDPPRPAAVPVNEAAAVRELKSYRPSWFARLFDLDVAQRERLQAAVERAKEHDRLQHKRDLAAYEKNAALVAQQRKIAKRILGGDPTAYAEVMDELDLCASPLVGRQVIYSFPDPTSAEVFAYLNGDEIIPTETKTLLSSGRVSTRKRSRTDFGLLYQDHLCSAVLRLGRDFIGRLPVKNVLVHAFVTGADSATGQPGDRCVISCLLTRDAMERIDFDHIDPSKCLSTFPNAMKISRGVLTDVIPLALDGTQPKPLTKRQEAQASHGGRD